MLCARPIVKGPLWLNDEVLARWEACLRVNDFIAKCAVFVGRTTNDEFKLLGRAFFVSYPMKEGACQYMVTAQHLVVGRTDLQVRINLRGAV